MISRAYGRSLNEDEIDDVYAAAWAATLSALRVRGERMSDGELRAYVLTAVASHASKELRRRTRKPSGPLESTHEQVISDVHVPLPDEAVIGAESAGVARDVLMSLPPRRRAVMLLRYGWGLSPHEVCALVANLSPRAYRKEVTRGVEQLIEGLRQVESGEWCKSREPLLRDYVAGITSDDERRQVEHHLGHCRACSRFAARLTGHVHDASAGVALASVAGLLGASGLGVGAKVVAGLATAKLAIAGAIDRFEAAASSAASTMTGQVSGAASAGVAAKMAAGGGGKAILACLGTGAAATACVAAGVVPGVGGLSERDDSPTRSRSAPVERAFSRTPMLNPARATKSIVQVGTSVASAEGAETDAVDPSGERSHEVAGPQEAVAPQEASAPELAAQEFDPVVEASTTPAPSSPLPVESAPEPSVSSGGSSAASIAGDEFGP